MSWKLLREKFERFCRELNGRLESLGSGDHLVCYLSPENIKRDDIRFQQRMNEFLRLFTDDWEAKVYTEPPYFGVQFVGVEDERVVDFEINKSAEDVLVILDRRPRNITMMGMKMGKKGCILNIDVEHNRIQGYCATPAGGWIGDPSITSVSFSSILDKR